MLAQLEAPPLLRRLDLASDRVLSARGVLAPRDNAASGAGSTRRRALGFLDLPHAVALQILSRLPADERARTALVCRFWRSTVADASLWTVLDLSPASGVAQPVTDATLRGAAALARGGLTVLCLDGCYRLSQEAQLEVVTANAGSLRELSCKFIDEERRRVFRPADIQALVDAAPQLVSFKVDVCAPVAVSTRILRNEAPYGALELCRLSTLQQQQGEAPLNEPELLAFCTAMSAHTSLAKLDVQWTSLDSLAVIDALSAAALACNLRDLKLEGCDLSPASVPALARLIRGGVLRSLLIDNGEIPLLDEVAAVQLAGAVAASRTLTRLKLESTRFWDNARAVDIMMRALTGHPCLQELDFMHNRPLDQLAAGAALGALVAANAPALACLYVSFSALGDAGLGGLFYALPRNTHLRGLGLCSTRMTAAFARNTLLPSVQSNTSLRMLDASSFWADTHGDQAPPELLGAEAVVAARNNGDD